MALLTRLSGWGSPWKQTKHGFLAILLSLIPLVCAAQGQERFAEYRIKAAYLYKFCDYVEWPEGEFDSSDSPLVIGVMGADHMAADLQEIIKDRTVNGRPVTVRALRLGDSLQGVHVLFIARSEGSEMESILAGARLQSILTVTETEGFPPEGSVINFVMIGDRIRFDVALESARKSNLKISSRLLAVARNVTEGAS